MPGNKFYLLLLLLQVAMHAPAQNPVQQDPLPVNIIPAANDTSKALVMYITGDGGWNKFSKNLSQSFADKGYPVVALNSKEYFWKKKTPEQTASAIASLIKTYQVKFNRKKIILIGYSFGGDIMPFVYSLLPVILSAQVVNINLLSPSPFTDFEIHVLGMMGVGSSGGKSVVAAINKISSKPITLIFGDDENDFPVSQLINKNFVNVRLDGGHHYDGDEMKVCNSIILHLPK